MKIVTSWDDGHKLDLRVADLLEKYNIPGTFFIPNSCLYYFGERMSEEEIKSLSDRGFEIGGHTVSHPPDLKELFAEVLEYQISSNKKWLEKITGKEVKSFCYPKGKYDKEVVNAVKEAGFKRARTVDIMEFIEPANPYKIRTSIHIHPKRKEYNNRPWYEVAEELLEKAINNPDGYFHLWGHSWEVEKYNLWTELEQILKIINQRLTTIK